MTPLNSTLIIHETEGIVLKIMVLLGVVVTHKFIYNNFRKVGEAL